jgi:TPR repeat protein
LSCKSRKIFLSKHFQQQVIHAEAQFIFGLNYAKGEGVAKDYVEAYKWLLLSAAQGDEIAKKQISVWNQE